MVQGEFEVVGGTGGSGLPGPGITGHGGITGPSGKLPSPDSPVSDVNSILAGAHLQVGKLFITKMKDKGPFVSSGIRENPNTKDYLYFQILLTSVE